MIPQPIVVLFLAPPRNRTKKSFSGMPKLTPQVIEQEIAAKKLRSIYWIYGPERMKSRQLIRHLEQLIFSDQEKNDFNFEKFQPSRADMAVSIETVWDSFRSISLMGGAKLVLVTQADELKNLEEIEELLKEIEDEPEQGSTSEIQSVLIFVSNALDARRKWVKALEKSAALVACDEVLEQDRDRWIDHLARQRKLSLTESEKILLRSLDPWSLDLVDMELSKLQVLTEGDSTELREEVLLQGVNPQIRDQFIEALFTKNSAQYWALVPHFSREIETQLMLLGLIAWNVRQLKQLFLEEHFRSSSFQKRNPYLQKNLNHWKKHWNLEQLQELEYRLFEFDDQSKTTRHAPLGLWTVLGMPYA